MTSILCVYFLGCIYQHRWRLPMIRYRLWHWNFHCMSEVKNTVCLSRILCICWMTEIYKNCRLCVYVICNHSKELCIHFCFTHELMIVFICWCEVNVIFCSVSSQTPETTSKGPLASRYVGTGGEINYLVFSLGLIHIGTSSVWYRNYLVVFSYSINYHLISFLIIFYFLSSQHCIARHTSLHYIYIYFLCSHHNYNHQTACSCHLTSLSQYFPYLPLA